MFRSDTEVLTTTKADAIRGTVLGTVRVEGTGIGGVDVRLVDASDGQVLSRVTDAAGEYSFVSISGGRYSVEITSPSPDVVFERDSAEVFIVDTGQTTVVDFDGVFSRTSSIQGAITVGGVPLSGISVSASGRSTDTTSTDANGQFAFGDLSARTYMMGFCGDLLQSLCVRTRPCL